MGSVTLKNICKSYNDKDNHHKIVLQNFNFTFDDKTSYCIMGNSGSGKTTLVNIIAGLIKYNSGEISGLENKKISMVFQDDRLIKNLSVKANINAVCGKPLSTSEISDILHSVSLDDCIKKPVNELSGGMKRRVAIVRAFVVQSDIVLMDEPFKGLDVNTKKTVVNYVKENIKDKLFIFVTHDREDAELIQSTIINIPTYI